MSEKNSVLETPETALENKKKDIGLYNKAKEVLEKTESDVTEEQPLTENELGNNIEIPIPFRPRVFKSVIDYGNKLISDMYDNLYKEKEGTIEIFDIRQEFDNFDLYSMIFNLLCLSKILYSSNIDKYDYVLEDMSNDTSIYHRLNLNFGEKCENNKIINLSLTTIKHEETDEFYKDSILGEVSVEINAFTFEKTYVVSLKNATENKDIFELAKLLYAIDYKYKNLCVNCGNRYKNTQKCNIFELNRDALNNINANIIDSKLCVSKSVIGLLRKSAFVQNDIIRLCENNQM